MKVQLILDRKGDRLITLAHDLPVVVVAEVMAEERIGTAIMVDHDGELAGIISERDIVKCIAENGSDIVSQPASEIMTGSPITCSPDTSLEEVLSQMSEHTIRHLPVLRDDNLMGMISVRDVLDLQRELLITDVERRVKTEAAMKQAIEEAELANRAKTEFLATMSHELKTPLNAIVGFSESLHSETFGPLGSSRNKDFIADIHASGKHLLEIINDILDIARIETGDRRPDDSMVDVQRIASTCLRMISERAQQARIGISGDITSSALRLRVDERMLKQMLMNLLTNAVNFTPHGGAVTLHSSVNDEGELVISVTDNGIGIAPDKIEKIIEPFNQVDGSLTRNVEGAGLGLALVNAMMQLHDGSLDITSALGEGTTVMLHFPANRTAGRHAAADEKLSA